MIAERRRSIL